ncbi:MAG: GNAT family N-acetyltransferase [Anaerolineales bacterium]|nr:GNAT family N-acetyltransferase [Anaerolineales bacterium]
MDAVRPHFHGLRSVYLFLPERKTEIRVVMEGLGFSVERFSYVLECRHAAAEEAVFPAGYSLQVVRPEDRIGIRLFPDLINRSFRDLAGHVECTPRMVSGWFGGKSYLAGGLCLLECEGEPVGTVHIRREEENNKAAEGAALSVETAHQGRGLGRMLLRHAKAFARQNGLRSVILSVNAENESAIRLYRSEGFFPVETAVCYSLACGRKTLKYGREEAI